MAKNLTVVAIDFVTHELTARAIDYSLGNIDPQEIVIVSDRAFYPGAVHVPCKPVRGMTEYAELMLKWVWPLINTDHALFVQWDGIAHNKNQWTDDFLKYDYIGAPWSWEPEGKNIGNGGFSLRSKRLLDACRDPRVYISEKRQFIAEDAAIGIDHRSYLESQHGIKFPSTKLAQQFSYELGPFNESFGFHGFWNVINLLPRTEVEKFIIHRPAAVFDNHHRAHHAIIALARRGYLDLFDLCVDDIKQGKNFLLLLQWLQHESFVNKDHVLSKLQ